MVPGVSGREDQNVCPKGLQTQGGAVETLQSQQTGSVCRSAGYSGLVAAVSFDFSGGVLKWEHVEY